MNVLYTECHNVHCKQEMNHNHVSILTIEFKDGIDDFPCPHGRVRKARQEGKKNPTDVAASYPHQIRSVL